MFRRCFSRECLITAFLTLLLSLGTLAEAKSGSTRPHSRTDARYTQALATADRLLQAWHNGDIENGAALLSSEAKKKMTAVDLESFFSNPHAFGYEIGHGKRQGASYEFPVVMFDAAEPQARVRRRFSCIVVSQAGHNDWVIDRIP